MKLRTVGEILFVVALISLAVALLGRWLYPHADPFGVKKGRFKVLPPVEQEVD